MPPDLAPTEEDQRRALQRSQHLATSLLAGAGTVFLATFLVEAPGFWVRLIRAGAEAAMIGGLADWFAITALFRHPFGLPVPHTALIPRNKDRIGAGLGAFIERHFLEPEEISRKLRALDPARRLGQWLDEPGHAEGLARRLTSAGPYLVRTIADPSLRVFVENTLQGQRETFQLSPLIGQAVQMMMEADHHHTLIDHVLTLTARLIAEHEQQIYEKVSAKSAWWIPAVVDRHIAEAILMALYELLARLKDPQQEVRQRLNTALVRWLHEVPHTPAWHEKIAHLKARVLGSPALRAYWAALWDEARHRVADDAVATDSKLKEMLTRGLLALAQALREDESLRTRLNHRIESLACAILPSSRAEVGAFIVEVVQRWDGPTVARRIEIEVGRDLQYIRLNGTIVGAGVGCFLFLVSFLLFGL
ncbi:MAG: hypothetical protein FD149_1713 [Rhodospirillaceae bacterium]|nr:MAG: hypothetical protein FD149_1713 [Rhodospirillaceae bacterium]